MKLKPYHRKDDINKQNNNGCLAFSDVGEKYRYESEEKY